MKPIIGLTPSPSDDTFRHGTFHRYAMASTYTEAIEAAGGVPVVLPPQSGNIDELLSIVDGLLLSGGGDIRPALYGDQDVHPATYGVHDLRDQLEINLVRAAIGRDLPVLCICRGIQVLNVALGGSLVQDIADQYGRDLEHRQQEHGIPNWDSSHAVHLEADSLAGQVYGATTIQVNSFHHQALRDVSRELRIVGRAPDGIIEAVERPSSSWLVGVQWHPEMMFRAHPEHLRPFQALVAAVTAQRGAVTPAD